MNEYAYDSGPMLVLRSRFGSRLEPHEVEKLADLTAGDFAEAEEILAAHPAFAARLEWLGELDAIRERYRPADGSTSMADVIADMTAADRTRYAELVALTSPTLN